MNRIFLLIIISLLFSCKSPSQENNNSLNKTEIANNLKESFDKKDEVLFLDNFPKNFEGFKNTFGWNDEKDSSEPFYKEANNYVDYWFSLIQQLKYKKYENQIISISKDGKWEADAVNYFKEKSYNYIKNNKKYDLINSLSRKDAESVLFFLFDPSHSKYDEDFVTNLNKEKQEIVKGIFSNNISPQKKRGQFSNYENNESYFIKTFDVNKDGIPDKIVSNNAYQGNDLFVFLGDKNKEYNLNLETTNFSEDGGNIIQDIIAIPHSKGLTIKTYFPDRGYFEKEYNLVPENNTWILKNTIYKTMSDNSDTAVKYICDVTQNIDITKSGWTDKINPIPEENDRNKKCRVETATKIKKQSIIKDPDGFTNLRKEKNSTSEILQKINSGEHINVLDISGDWFFVKTKEGKQGYVHKSRIKAY
ncbi:SH3 domain-containing protein [Halpernia frigidisoli]|uniref:SH3 domain-containing protein n=1 Tax=Halpernia frigidisoli TaxID=1125876 RepID=A0A1I3IPN9_9FLAO|nr:SH3 domain-containing protein [Halpernia frigidisoli]SFI49830.1 SH3 domain-containing protein [Halpernia frigidisoli]